MFRVEAVTLDLRAPTRLDSLVLMHFFVITFFATPYFLWAGKKCHMLIVTINCTCYANVILVASVKACMLVKAAEDNAKQYSFFQR